MKEKIKEFFKDKQNLLIIGLIIIIILLIFTIVKAKEKEEVVELDNIKFAKEYTQVGEDNLYVYRTNEEIIKILENGSGVVLIGFPECPWCQRYALYLNEVAKDLDYEKIYYYNVLEDRKNNTEEYKKIVVDSAGYKAKREETLKGLAKRTAARVVRENRNVALEPMNAFERRIIHSELADHAKVETESRGNEPNRYVVIKLKGKSNKQDKRKEKNEANQSDISAPRAYAD